MNRQTWLESLTTPVIAIQPIAEPHRTTDAPMMEYLIRERELLETRYTAQRSLLDSLIDRFNAAANGRSATTPRPVTPPAPTGDDRQSMPDTVAPSKARKGHTKRHAPAPRKPRPDSVLSQVVALIAEQKDDEFSTSTLAGHFKLHYKACISAIMSLKSRGWIEQIRHGWWKVTPKFEPPVSQKYAAFRESLGELKAPENMVSNFTGRGEA